MVVTGIVLVIALIWFVSSKQPNIKNALELKTPSAITDGVAPAESGLGPKETYLKYISALAAVKTKADVDAIMLQYLQKEVADLVRVLGFQGKTDKQIVEEARKSVPLVTEISAIETQELKDAKTKESYVRLTIRTTRSGKDAVIYHSIKFINGRWQLGL